MAFRTTTVTPLFPSTRAKDGLWFVAKCYVPENSNANGVTLALFHCSGSHKEAWEPTLEHLFSMKNPDGTLQIHEAWSFEMQSHGEAAILNDTALEGIGSPLTVEEYSDGVKRFIASGALKGRKLIGIGHSLGGTALLLTTMSDELPGVKYDAIVLVEPALITREAFDANLEEREGALRDLAEAVSKRRDVWNTREEAQKYFSKRFPWAVWNPRVVELYVRYGLREVSIPSGNEIETKVTLCCTKVQERATYLHVSPHFVVLDTIRNLDDNIPLHFLLGERVDLIPEYIHKSVIDLRQVASVRKIPDGGHFVVQENPEGLANAIHEVLTGSVSRKANL